VGQDKEVWSAMISFSDSDKLTHLVRGGSAAQSTQEQPVRHSEPCPE
jgi:hypothetical protein